MTGKVYNVLFLCTHNSARSLVAESILRKIGAGKFNAYSAGSHPTGTPNTFVLEYLKKQRLPTDGLRSKSWDEFASPNAPLLDFVITVCDSAAGEVCPVWPGQPVTAHWGVEDPSQYNNNPERARQAVREVAQILQRRISYLVVLPIEKLDRLSLQQRVREISKNSL